MHIALNIARVMYYCILGYKYTQDIPPIYITHKTMSWLRVSEDFRHSLVPVAVE